MLNTRAHVLICTLALTLGCLVVGWGTAENETLWNRVETARNVVEKAEAGIKGTFINVPVLNDSIDVEKRRPAPNLDEVMGVDSDAENRDSCIGRERALPVE